MNQSLSRRDLLVAGGMLLGAAALAGCASGSAQHATLLPDPAWPNPGRMPKVPRPKTVALEPIQTPTTTEAIPTGIMARSRWTSAGVARANEINPMNGVSRITVHHAGFPCGDIRSQAAAAARIESVRKSHVNSRGWADIGYHYIIDPQGCVWAGRDTRYQGAHVQDNNEHNLGIMLLGDFDREKPTKAAIVSLDRLVAQQMRSYNVPIGRVFTHGEIRPTACPGRSLQAHMVKARSSAGSIRTALAALEQLGSPIRLA